MKIFKVTNDKYIWRGPLPETKEDMDFLKNFEFPNIIPKGFKTIVNLNCIGDKKEEILATRAGIAFYDLDIPGYFFPSVHSVLDAVNLIENPRYHPVYLHCRHGRERTGLVVAAYRILVEKWPVQMAYEEMVKMGCRAPHKWIYKMILKGLTNEA